MRLHWCVAAVVVCGSCGGRGVIEDPQPTDAAALDGGTPDAPAQVPGDADAGAADPCPAGVPRTVSLDGLWSATYRQEEGVDYFDSAEPHALGSVAVPGWLLPYDRFPKAQLAGQVAYERDLTWPVEWACAPPPGTQVIVELESADYQSVVLLDGVELGRHRGYIGSFSAPVPWGSPGRIEVLVQDFVHDVDHWGGMERFRHRTVQGADEGGWGVNPVGLPGSVRLRLVGPVSLPHLYAAPVSREGSATRVRVGLEAEGSYELEGAKVTADITLTAPSGGTLLTESRQATLDGDGRARLLVEVVVEGLADVPVGGTEEATVEVTLRHEGRVSDVRTTPLVNRRVRLVGSSLEVNEERHFARGAATYHGLRLAPFSGPYAPMTYASVEELLPRYAALLGEARAVGAQWLRPAHHVPDPAFLRAARAAGFLLYQDFPLHWNTSVGVGTKFDITREFTEFLWRVAAEPAVAIIAIHNEAEIGETNAAELAWCRSLIGSLMGVAQEIAPHLVVIGCSGCGGTAVFPPDPAWSLDEALADRHAYFGSWWQPWDGYGDLPARVEGLAEGPLPVLWSELGNGWTKHFAYLAALEDTLEPASPPPLVALRAEIEGWLEAPNGTSLTLRQFYAALWCLRENGVSLPRVPACVAEVAPGPDAELIAFAKAHFLGDRPAVEGDPKDPASVGALVAAHWLASQVFEARWQWAQGAGFLGVLSWERPENGYPFSTPAPERVPSAAVERSRAIVAAANAPVAAALRLVGGQVEARVVNDEGPRTLTLRLAAGDDVLWTQEVPVGRGAGVAELAGPSILAGRAGQLLRLEVTDGAVVATAAMVYAP
ncbi:MAG: hypothetical protein AMXMBFR64_42520 [Myxococcales bacterium]